MEQVSPKNKYIHVSKILSHHFPWSTKSVTNHWVDDVVDHERVNKFSFKLCGEKRSRKNGRITIKFLFWNIRTSSRNVNHRPIVRIPCLCPPDHFHRRVNKPDSAVRLSCHNSRNNPTRAPSHHKDLGPRRYGGEKKSLGLLNLISKEKPDQMIIERCNPVKSVTWHPMD